MATRTLSYRRAVWLQGGHHSLESYISQARLSLPKVVDRGIPRYGGQVLKCQRVQESQTGGVSIHITAETPGDLASIVPSNGTVDDGDVSVASAPAGSEFMDGDIFAYIVENDVCICTSGLREQSLAFYLSGFFEKAGLDQTFRQFDLQAVGNANKLRLIARGVKRIDLGATVQEATVAYANRRGEPRGMVGGIGRELLRFFGHQVRDIEDNLQVAVSIRSDGRLKEGVRAGEQRLEDLAESLIQSEGDDYTILTKDGQIINQREVFVRTRINIEGAGKSVARIAAWDALRDFYASLIDAGITEE